MICPKDPPQKKNKKKRGGGNQTKASQGHVPWLNGKEKFQNSFSQYANNVETHLFRSTHRAQNTTHALSQLGVSQNSSQAPTN